MKKIIFFMMFFVFNITCLAAHLDLELIPNTYSAQTNLGTSVFYSGRQNKYIMGGDIVYCTSPGVEINTREYSEFDASLSPINRDVLKQMELISYYGYDYPTHKSSTWFMASQELIWELLNQEVHFTTERNNAGNIIDINYEKNEIMNLINNHNKIPSFAYNEISNIYGNTITLTDTNNVISEFELVSTNNNVSIDGNTLTINLTTIGNDTIQFKKRKYDNSKSKYFSVPNSQDFMFLRPSEDVTFEIKVESYLPKSNISVYKKGEMLTEFKDKFIYEEKGLTGVEFNIYAEENIYEIGNIIYNEGELVDSFKTIDGIGTSKELPNGKYILKEKNTIDGFILNEEEISIELNNSNKEVYNYMIELNNERQKIFINLNKLGEEFTGVSESDGVYNKIPLEGIKFGLYSTNPIYNYDGKLLIDKDNLIDTLVTDSKGIIKEELDIPFGSYYLKELETINGYKLDPNIYEFSVLKNEDDTQIFITKEPIVNELIKSNLVIYKIDEEGNYLSGAKFKIFDDYDNLIYEGETDNNGVINISNLGYGKYHFYEVSAPDGYFVDDKLYEFFVTDDNELIEIKIKNEKLPVTSNIYAIPRKLSTIGLGFGLATLSLALIYDKKYKNN